MNNWKCEKCGYTMSGEKPSEKCPSCNAKCSFVDNSCYTPDCQCQGIDKRIK